MKPEPLRARLGRHQAKPTPIPQGLRRLDSPEDWAKAVFQATPRTLTEAIEEQPVPKKANGQTNRTLSDEQLWGDR